MEISRDLFRKKRWGAKAPTPINGQEMVALENAIESSKMSKGITQIDARGFKVNTITLDAIMAGGGTILMGQGEGGQAAMVVKGQELIAEGLRRGGNAEAQLGAYRSSLLQQNGVQQSVVRANARLAAKQQEVNERIRGVDARVADRVAAAEARSGARGSATTSVGSLGPRSTVGGLETSIYSAGEGTVHSAAVFKAKPTLGWESDDE
jgi:hypothetical protein